MTQVSEILPENEKAAERTSNNGNGAVVLSIGIGVGGSTTPPIPSHTTGHAGPHPAV